MFLQNGDIYLKIHTVLQPRIPTKMSNFMFAHLTLLKCSVTYHIYMQNFPFSIVSTTVFGKEIQYTDYLYHITCSL
jgi:hypothetical protein